MSGGISIALGIIAVLVIGGIVAFTYFTGGFVKLTEPDEESEPRRAHKEPTTPLHEHREFVGTDQPE
jgi:hypothetical protein